MCAIAKDELHVIRVGAGTNVLQHNGGFCMVTDLDGGGTERGHVLALARIGNGDGIFHLHLRVNGYHLTLGHGGPCLGGHAVRRLAHAAKTLIVTVYSLRRNAWVLAYLDVLGNRLSKLPVVQAPQLAQGNKAPDLIAAVRYREILHVGRGKDVTLGDLIRIEFVRSDHFFSRPILPFAVR